MQIRLNTIILSSDDTYFTNDNGIDFIDPTFNPDWVNLKLWFAGNGPMPQKSGSVITNTIKEYPKIKNVFDTTEITHVSDVSAQFKIKTRDSIDLYWNIIKNEDENDLEFDVEMKKFNRSEISGNERIENINIEKTIDIPNNLTGKEDYKLKLVALDLSGNFKKSKSLNFKTLESGLIFEDLEKEFILKANGGNYLLNNKTTYDTKNRYKLGKGIYTLKDVPVGHPVAIMSDSPHISYYGAEENRVTEGISQNGYFYYHGDVRIIVKGDFKTASLHCGYHGYMGAKNILHYDKNKSGEQLFKSDKIEELPEDNLDLEQIYFGLDNSFEIELPESVTLSQQSQISLSRNINENILLSTGGQEQKMPKILLKELSGNEVLREIEAKNITKDEMNSRKYKGDISFNIKSDQKLEDISKNEYEFDIIFNESNNIIQKKKTYKIKTKVKRPKILCLHGGGQSVDNFKNQEGIKDLSNNLGREFEFIFADSSKRKKIGSEQFVDEARDVWWKDPDSKGEPTIDPSHADASIKYLDDKINEEKPVYGILGYSQGAAMATTYLASKNEEGEERSKNFEKAFLYNGYLPTTHLGLMEKINDSSLDIPTMIYLSEQDEVIAPELTMRMKNKFKRHKEISTNRGGHRLPRKREGTTNDENFNETLDFIRRRKEKDEDILVENIETEIPIIEEFEYSEPTDSSLNIYVQLNVNGKVRLSLRQEKKDNDRKKDGKDNKIQFKDNDDNNNVKDIKVGFHDKGYNEKDKDWTEDKKPDIKKHYQTFHKEVSGNELVTFDISGLQPDEKYIVECHAKGENGYVSRPRRIMFETKPEITDNPEQPDDGEAKAIYVQLRDGINSQTPDYIQFSEDKINWDSNHDRPSWAIKGKKYEFIVADSLGFHPMEFYLGGHDQVIRGSDILSVGERFIIQTSTNQENIYYRCKYHSAMKGTIILDHEVTTQPVPDPLPNPGPKPILEHVHIGLDERGEFKFYRDFRFMIKNNNKEKDKFLDWPLINERYPILFKNRAYKFINYTNKPFYISENEIPDISNVNISDDGSFNDGITGNKNSNKINAESLILTFKASFDINKDRLFYYDTTDVDNLNNNTLKEFEILPSKERTISIPSLAPVLSNNKVTFNILNNFRDSNDMVKTNDNEISQQDRSNLEEIKNKSMEILQKYIINYPKSYDIQLAWGDFTSETAQSIMGYAIPIENRIVLNKAKIAETSTLNGETVKTLTVTLIHEILHIFGLIGINIDETTTTQDVTINNRKYVWKFYVADKGINQYKNLLINLKQQNANNFKYMITKTNIAKLEINTIDNLKYILLEDDFGEGTVHVHLEEGIDYDYTLEQKITLENGQQIHYPSIMNEITTGFQNQTTYLTRITLGMLEDLNFKINYSRLDDEENVNGYFNNIIVV